MRFKFYNNIIDVDEIEYDERIISKHTGNELERFSINFEVKGNKRNLLKEAITNSKNDRVFSIDVAGNNLKEYKIVNHTSICTENSYDEETIYSYTLKLEQIETLKLDHLIIAGIEVIPYKYSEEYDNGIIIDANVKLTKEQNASLLSAIGATKYFEVERVGISHARKIMRFGKIIWSEHNDYIKKNLILVENVYDDVSDTSHMFYEPQFGNIMKSMEFMYNKIKNLEKTMIEKGLISDNESSDFPNLEFYKVDDIDKW